MNKIKPRETSDHTGRMFKSITDMCRHWKIKENLYSARIRLGWSKEQALTTPIDVTHKKKDNPSKDHEGNIFASEKDMCEHWGINLKTFMARIKRGWTIKDALTKTPTNVHGIHDDGQECYDHTGQKFASIKTMCEHWNTTDAIYRSRIKTGATIEEALTNEKKEIYKQCTDHEGNNFPSVGDMCDHWQINRPMYNYRIKNGMTIKEALTTPTRQPKVTDPLGRPFISTNEMIRYYGLRSPRNKTNNPDAKSLGKMIENKFKNKTMDNGIRMIKCVQFPFFLTEKNGQEKILHIDDILKKHHHNFIPKLNGNPKHRKIKIIKQLEFPNYLINNNGREEIWNYWQLSQDRTQNNKGNKTCTTETSNTTP